MVIRLRYYRRGPPTVNVAGPDGPWRRPCSLRCRAAGGRRRRWADARRDPAGRDEPQSETERPETAAARSRTARAGLTVAFGLAAFMRERLKAPVVEGEQANESARLTQSEGVGQDAEHAPPLERLEEDEIDAAVTHLLRRHDVAPARDQDHRRRWAQLLDRAGHVDSRALGHRQ